ncbi:hypothetical protein B0J13DRAFT_532665 [Dactylonectria estremocensis]|uniref:Uncharacterized protein n=1 Tax=Dactylonectria estremocensis TaxID=1079267 RepID=A0A9P9DGK5_9HYPO|nr:hypothetical protein B0J13DRAFT_532665 [Dactylonectria estremocensis]
MILKYPHRPTLSLGSLDPNKTPTIESVTETGHQNSTGSSRSTSAKAFAKAVDLASGFVGADTSRYRDLSFGNVDHEIRSFSHELKSKALRAIVQLRSVDNFITGRRLSWLNKRPVYVISGLQVAKIPFSVTKTAKSTSSSNARMSMLGNMSGGPVLAGGGGGATFAKEEHQTGGYNTAPDTSAFMTGPGNDKDGQELKLDEVTGQIVKECKEVTSMTEEHPIDDMVVVAFRSS